MKYLCQSVVLCLILYCSVTFSSAQDILLDPITITSSLTEKRASETGRNIVTIQGSTLANLPVNSIDEMLRYLPGVEIQARGPMGSQSDIVLRGGTFQQVLVILDGIRLNDPNTGHFSSYIPIAPSEIARIEVLKGASSAIYGSEAVGGVVHVITKSFQSRLDSTTNVQKNFSGSLSTGMHGLINAQAGANWQSAKAAISIGALSNNAQGEQQRGTNGYFHNHTFSSSAKLRINPHTTLAIRGAADFRNFAAQNFYTTLLADTAREEVNSTWLHAQLKRQLTKGQVTFDASHKRLVDVYAFNPSSIPNKSTSQLSQGLLTWKHNLGQAGSIVSGLHYQMKHISSNDRGEHIRHAVAPFILYHYTIGKWHLHPSLRADWRSTLGIELVPQINIAYKTDHWQWRSTIGKSIRDADFTERFNNYNKPLVNGGSIGYPSLRAEKATSYEVGADWFASKSLKLSASIFERRHHDLIDYVPTPYALMPQKDNLSPSGSFALARNIASVNTRGLEIDMQFMKQFASQKSLFIALGNQWLQSKSPEQVVSFYLSSHARWLSNMSVQYRHQRFLFAFNSVYKVRDPQVSDALQVQVSKQYFLMNTRIQYQFNRLPLAVYTQIDNVGDIHYVDLLGSKMPGRWVMIGIKFNYH